MNDINRSTAMIGKTIQFDGNIKGDEDLVVEGVIEGTVTLSNQCLTIATGGMIRGDVLAKTILVEGEVRGELRGTESVEIGPSGIVHGDIRAPRVTLRDGCQFKGMVDMDHKEPVGEIKRPKQPISPMLKNKPIKNKQGLTIPASGQNAQNPQNATPKSASLASKLLGSKA